MAISSTGVKDSLRKVCGVYCEEDDTKILPCGSPASVREPVDKEGPYYLKISGKLVKGGCAIPTIQGLFHIGEALLFL